MLGGGNSAGQAVLHLQRYAADVRLVVRSAALGEGMSQYLVDEIEATPGITVHLDSEVVDGGAARAGCRRSSSSRPHDRRARSVPADGLFVMIGAEPHTVVAPRGGRSATSEASC